jgi:nucleoside-triphosphatase THEP1
MSQPNTLFNLATRVINHTGKHLFLTGRAGTGKTTFLRHIQRTTPKKTVVVAPTGVAAINAGGVTMHSFFQLPLGMYIADASDYYGEEYSGALVVNKRSLFRNIRFNREKIELLRELELLIIDEVSMLRADALDAIDTVLRHFRRKPKQPFGGVQVLYIGDLFQLPPVLTQGEAALFYEHYRSPFFFHAKVMDEEPPLLIELKHIYRQSDEQFIHVLNTIRNNRATEDELEILHQHYKPWQQPEEGMIVLTTHNSKADSINSQRLASLAGKSYSFEGVVNGEFNDKALPVDRSLQLKIGAQIMFIKNDSGAVRRYYNGKLATVDRVDDEGDVWVRLAGSNEELRLEHHTWRSVRYKYNRDKDKIDEEELGSYKQYPVRLAWAITIHKSQGLTFERAIIDAGQSFAAGQVYVALSRLTSLEGLVLHSRIPAQGIEMPEAVLDFCKREMDEDLLVALVRDEEQAFAQEQLVNWFSFEKLSDSWALFHTHYTHRGIPNVSEAADWSDALLKGIDKLEETARRFRAQLQGMLGRNTDWPAVKERVDAAQKWFMASLEEKVLAPLQQHFKAWSIKPRSKQYLAELRELETVALQLKKGWQQAQQLTISLAGGISYADIQLDVPIEASRLKAEAASKAKPKKGDTYAVTLAMYRDGKSISEIAAERSLTTGTIESHLTQFIPTGEVTISAFVTPDQYRRIVNELNRQDLTQGTGLVKAALGEEISFAMIRAVQAHLRLMKTA